MGTCPENPRDWRRGVGEAICPIITITVFLLLFLLIILSLPHRCPGRGAAHRQNTCAARVSPAQRWDTSPGATTSATPSTSLATPWGTRPRCSRAPGRRSLTLTRATPSASPSTTAPQIPVTPSPSFPARASIPIRAATTAVRISSCVRRQASYLGERRVPPGCCTTPSLPSGAASPPASVRAPPTTAEPR